MRNIFLAVAAFTLPAAVTAQPDASTLVQACQTLKRQSDRNKCLEEAIKSAATRAATPAPPAPAPESPPQPSPREIMAKRSENVFAAASALQSVVDLGVSYNDYSPYIQKLAVELGQYRSIAQLPEETEAIRLFEKALEAYNDAREYWYADINFYSRRDNRIAYGGSLPAGMAGVSHIIGKYSIPTQKSDIWGINYGATRGVALSTIWASAKTDITKARDTLTPSPRTPSSQTATSPTTSSISDIQATAEQMVLPKAGGEAEYLLANVFVGSGRVICGTVAPKAPHSDFSRRLFVANVETGSVSIEGSAEWTEKTWPAHCQLGQAT